MVGWKNNQKDTDMIIIAFSKNTSKFLPRILCRHYRHCAPILCNDSDLIMFQFVKRNHIIKVHLTLRDLAILRVHGWTFVYISPTPPRYTYDNLHAYSCVNMTKRILNIKSVLIQTPYALYKRLTKK